MLKSEKENRVWNQYDDIHPMARQLGPEVDSPARSWLNAKGHRPRLYFLFVAWTRQCH